MWSAITILLLAGILVAGIGIVAYFAYKTVQIQQKMILDIAIFKKASDPFQVASLRSSVEDAIALDKENEIPQADPNDQPTIPQNPSDEFMATLRAHI